MREIVFDTETTGLEAQGGDRLIEIGCVELFNHIATGRTFHHYLDPGRAVSEDAVRIHGITDAMLAGKPRFEAVVDEFLDFVADSALVAHNAAFDRGFLNMELTRAGRGALPDDRFVDTLTLARRRHPGAQNSLDALCARYGVDTSARNLHGALLDARLLAEVYLELLGGRQATLLLGAESGGEAAVATVSALAPRPHPLAPRLTEAERQAHRAFVATLPGTPVWTRYWSRER